MRRVTLALALAVAGVACRPVLRRPAYEAQPTSALVEVGSPPPPARVEIVPPSPSAEAVWVDGEWMWRRARWAWLPGRWVVASPGSSFSPWAFVRGGDGRFWYAPGVWRGAAGAPIDPPTALAIASVETGAVVTAEGATEETGPTVRQRGAPARVQPAPK